MCVCACVCVVPERGGAVERGGGARGDGVVGVVADAAQQLQQHGVARVDLEHLLLHQVVLALRVVGLRTECVNVNKDNKNRFY